MRLTNRGGRCAPWCSLDPDGDHLHDGLNTVPLIKIDTDAPGWNELQPVRGLTYRSGGFARGDENNQDANGKIPGYFLIDLDTTWQVTKHLQLFATVTNLLDKRYASFGIVGQNCFNGPNHTFDGLNPVNEHFVCPGAPRGGWVGARYAWD